MKYICLLILLISCSKDFNSPEGLIKFYIGEVTSKSLSKDFFKKYTTESLEESILSMNADDFENFQKANLADNIKIDIINENCNQNKCNLTFILKYTTSNSKGDKSENEVKKIAQLVRVEDHWEISEMSNIRTYLEAKSPIHIESR